MSDGGLDFTSKGFADFLAGRVIRHILNAIVALRANGQVERQNCTIICTIGANTECKTRWDEKLSEIVWGMNHCVNAHNSSSHTVVPKWRPVRWCTGISYGGRRMASSLDKQQAVESCTEKAAETLTKVRRAMKERLDKRRKVATEYQIGDLLLWRDAST